MELHCFTKLVKISILFSNNSLITFKIEGQHIQLNTSDIFYIESAPTVHKVLIHTKTRIISIYHSIKSLVILLDSNFFYRCNKSTIVNVIHIESLIPTDKKVRLATGKEITVYTKYYSKSKSYFNNQFFPGKQ